MDETKDYNRLLIRMADDTLKQLNPLTDTEVWTVPGRKSKPITNVTSNNPIPLTQKPLPEQDYCPFCFKNLLSTPPEKDRLTKVNNDYVYQQQLMPEYYRSSPYVFRRVANLFEIITTDYWTKNYNFKLPAHKYRWMQEYIGNKAGREHVLNIVKGKLKISGAADSVINNTSEDELLEKYGIAFFGGGHDVIIAGKHHREDAKYTTDLFSSGAMSPEEHYQYFKFTINALNDHLISNRYARYVIAFQNWLMGAGASIDHLHKQLVAIDEWGTSIEIEISKLRKNPYIYNELVVNFAGYNNRIIAENDFAVAFVDIGHRYPTIAIYSKSPNHRPMEHTPEELRGVSDLVHAVHRALDTGVPCNEEWYYAPKDALDPMPWHILIKLRINNPAGFEGGTKIYINPIHPFFLRDQMVPKLFSLRHNGEIASFKIAEECPVKPNCLEYYKEKPKTLG